jgi:hypothetical protein
MAPARFRRNPDVVERTIADETFLIPVKGDLATRAELFALSEVGQFVWSRLDGRRDTGEIAAEVAREFEVGEEQAGTDVGEFIEQLQQHGLAVLAGE